MDIEVIPSSLAGQCFLDLNFPSRFGADHCVTLFFQFAQQLIERRSKGRHTVLLKLLRNCVEIDAQSLQSSQSRRCVIETIPYSLSRHLTTIFEGIEGLGRQCIDRLSTDEVLNIKSIRIGRILSACAGPQRSLDTSATLAQRDKPLAMKNLEETVVNHFGIRDSDLTEQRLRLRLRRCESLED